MVVTYFQVGRGRFQNRALKFVILSEETSYSLFSINHKSEIFWQLIRFHLLQL